MHLQLANLDARLDTIEQGRVHRGATTTTILALSVWDTGVSTLAAETTQVLLDTGRCFLQSKLDKPHSSATPTIIREVSDNLLAPPPALQSPPLPCPDTPNRSLAGLMTHPLTRDDHRHEQPGLQLPTPLAPSIEAPPPL